MVTAQDEKDALVDYQNQFGVLPAVHCFQHNAIGADYFPAPQVKGAKSMGVHTIIRYHPFTNWQKIARGDYDKELDGFIKGVLETKIPFFFIPFPEAGKSAGVSHPWKDWNAKYFIPAWDRMHNRFEKAGANKYAVWGLHLIGSYAPRNKPRKYFWVPPEQVNWVGVSLWSREKTQQRSFKYMVHDDYRPFTDVYPTKPFACWEIGHDHYGSSYGHRTSGSFLKRAYEYSRELPRLKLISPWHFVYLFSNLQMDLFNPQTTKGYIEGMKSANLQYGGHINPAIK